MAIPPPTPLHNPLGDDLTPHELLDHLNSLLSDVLAPGAFIQSDGKAEITALLRDLSCIMMGEFPQAASTEWSLLGDRVQIIDVSLKLIDRALICVEDIVGGADGLERTLLAQFLGFSGVLSSWLTASKVVDSTDEGPLQLKLRVQNVALHMLEVLAGINKEGRLERRSSDSQTSFYACVEECLNVARDLSSKEFTEPFKVVFFETPRIRHHNQSQESPLTANVIIRSQAVCDLLVADSLLIVSQASLRHPLSKIAISSDIPFKAAKVCSSHFLKLLYERQQAPAYQLSLAIVHLLKVVGPLISIGSSTANPLIPYIHKMVCIRHNAQSDRTWETVDEALLKILKGLPEGTNLGFEASWIEDRILSCDADSNEKHASHDVLHECLRMANPLLSTNDREKLMVLITGHSSYAKREASLALLRQHPSSMDVDVGIESVDSAEWRRRIHRLVITWFFEGNEALLPFPEGVGYVEWCAKITQQVGQRIIGFYFQTSHEDRVETLRELIKLPCALVHREEQLCSETAIPGLSLIPAFAAMGMRLLEAAGTKVTAEYACLVYELFGQAANHHSQAFGGSKLEELVKVLKYGMQRQERTVRLTAGCDNSCLATLRTLT
ncbi:hypothetical protein M422DRAFT_238114 [Sphaerobolus stellatus SS14]|nr:hypothetical protein M422DRAFT_238114 [Sphaerobolus stellatus SS14]